ncbi:PREDICTED: tumor necrosis factor ligand superfamily member 10-like [Branchiostoma belcheri]|uniref:Tumor necrosis factor ligand superfamily member 10-like n=1 Tax=Branchiostoma belcheri TaxID=7741 RepID=A0A6P5AFD0_BRABE|nr:PREDICTED: tumor necrosis factor ligand superfamily member 10-like [Branchiostoma belcheri]
MMYNNGDLIIPQDGFYYVYSQVVYYRFLLDKTTGRKDTPYQMIHFVLKQTSYPEPQEILKSVRSSCWSRKAEFGLHTSYQGGVFRLQRGDRIWVACSNLHLVSLDETASFFGAFMV